MHRLPISSSTSFLPFGDTFFATWEASILLVDLYAFLVVLIEGFGRDLSRIALTFASRMQRYNSWWWDVDSNIVVWLRLIRDGLSSNFWRTFRESGFERCEEKIWCRIYDCACLIDKDNCSFFYSQAAARLRSFFRWMLYLFAWLCWWIRDSGFLSLLGKGQDKQQYNPE